MGWFNKLRNNCKKTTFLIDKKNLEGIRPLQHIELYTHLAGCSFCRLYDKQSHLIDQLAGEVYLSKAKHIQKLGDDFKIALQNNINEQLKNN